MFENMKFGTEGEKIFLTELTLFFSQEIREC